jgi:hypothetical protein
VLLVASAVTSALFDGRSPFPQAPVMKAVGFASRQIEREIAGQPIALEVRAPDGHYRRQLTLGLAYALRVHGYRTEIAPSWGLQLGSGYLLRGQRLPLALVTMKASAAAGSYTLTVRVAKELKPRW